MARPPSAGPPAFVANLQHLSKGSLVNLHTKRIVSAAASFAIAIGALSLITAPTASATAAGSHSAGLAKVIAVLGRYIWQVTASGAGPPVKAEATTRARPWGLAVLLLVLLVDVVVMVVRRRTRRQRKAGSIPSRVRVPVVPRKPGGHTAPS